MTSDQLPKTGGEPPSSCYNCGACTGGCPVSRFNARYNPRNLLKEYSVSPTKLAESELIWMCAICYTCSERCPQGIDLPEALIEAKNIAARMDRAPSHLRSEAMTLVRNGLTVTVSQSIASRRDKLGLPKLPSPSLEQISKLIAGSTLERASSSGVVEARRRI